MHKRPINLGALRGFLCAARHGSFTRAATELHLTQSALSRQIQGLEEELETPLFVRTTRKVALTPAGQRLAQVAGKALADIDAAAEELRPTTGPRPIAVTTFASFASLWLIPRLDRFAALQPGIDVHCMATDRVVDLDGEGFDVAFRAVGDAGVEIDGQPLFAELVVPVASPALLAAQAIRSPSDLAQHTLLAFEQVYEARFPQFGWTHWFESQGLKPLKPKRTLRFSNYDQIVQAALAGQGVALARAAMVGETLRDKRLLPILGGATEHDIRYVLVTSAAAKSRPEVRAFVDWALQEAAQTRRMVSGLARARRATA